MRWQRVVTVIATVLVVAVLAVALMPVYADHARLGLDLQGGVMVRLEAPEGTSDEDMNGAIGIIKNRIDSLGVAEPEVRREGSNRITVELAGIDDPEEAVEMIGTTAKLEFVRMDTGEVVISGTELAKASAYMDQNTIDPSEQFGVSLEFNKTGADKFGAATQELVDKYAYGDQNRIIAIVLDGVVISAPSVKSAIKDGKASISGSFQSQEEASNMAMLLNSGA